ncbi:MAG: hypothetical protein ACTSWW_05630 [Promethearchaeota archaeon]
MSSDRFLNTLLEVVSTQQSFIKAQSFRLDRLWKSHWASFGAIPTLTPFDLDPHKFSMELPYRIEILRKLQGAMETGFLLLEAIVDILFQHYFSSELIKTEFSSEDLIPLSLKVNDMLVGSLLQFVRDARVSIPVGFIAIGKYKTLMTLIPLPVFRMVEEMTNEGFTCDFDTIDATMKYLGDLGYVEVHTDPDQQNQERTYRFVKEFQLSPKGEKTFLMDIKPLIDWMVAMWQSLYNVRSLDTPVPEAYPHREELASIVSQAATQGYRTSHAVIQNIANYYETLIGQEI